MEQLRIVRILHAVAVYVVPYAFAEAGDWTLRFQIAPLPEESQQDDNQDTALLPLG